MIVMWCGLQPVSLNALHLVATMNTPGPGFTEMIDVLIDVGCCPTVVWTSNEGLADEDSDAEAPERGTLWEAIRTNPMYDEEYANLLPVRVLSFLGLSVQVKVGFSSRRERALHGFVDDS